MQRSSRAIIIAIVLLVIAFFGFRAFSRPDPPDNVQIDEALRGAAHAAERRNIGGVLQIISEHYEDDSGNNPERIRILLGRGLRNVDDLHITVSPSQVKVSGDKAHSSCYLTVRGNGQLIYNQLINLDWSREDSHKYLIIPTHVWRIVHSTYSGGFGDI